jgi:hypothetical protein
LSNKQPAKKKNPAPKVPTDPPQIDNQARKATVYLTPEQNLALERIRLNYLAKHHRRLHKQALIRLGVDLAIAKYEQDPPLPSDV